MKIGVIGYGYVGSAVAHSYSRHEVMIHDPAYPDLNHPLENIKSICEVIFVCVPTPSTDNGQCDVSILQSTLHKLSDYTGLVICKSTAPPDIYQNFQNNLPIKLAHVPEFLTQARAKQDYLNPHKILVGCVPELRDSVTRVIRNSDVNFDWVSIEYCSVAEASFFKYMANAMLAMKVSVCNEFYDLCQSLNLEWSEIVRVAKNDTRLGNTHWAVPGPDGSRGFGGACFPKDTQAIQHMAQVNQVNMPVLRSCITANQKLRGRSDTT